MKQIKRYLSRRGFEPGTTIYGLDVVVLAYAFLVLDYLLLIVVVLKIVLSYTLSVLKNLIYHRHSTTLIKMLNLMHVTP